MTFKRYNVWIFLVVLSCLLSAIECYGQRAPIRPPKPKNPTSAEKQEKKQESEQVFPPLSGQEGQVLVSFIVTPPEAILTVDQEEIITNEGNAELEIIPGEHTFMVVLPGYISEGGKFTVEENETINIFIQLEPKDSSKIESPNNNASSNQNEENNEIFVAVEQPAEFPGGQEALMNWLNRNLEYPSIAAENDIQGRVVVRFAVEKDGSLSHAEILKSIDPALDEAALRVVKLMPKWNPGRQNGVIVRSFFNLPINFKFQNEEQEK